jgi:hypothetical protein
MSEMKCKQHGCEMKIQSHWQCPECTDPYDRIADLEVQNKKLLALVRNIEGNTPRNEDEIVMHASWKLWVAGERCRALLTELNAKGKAR